MTGADEELHRAKRELDQLVARMRDSEHARAFLCYADAVVFGALRDLPRNQWESPKVSTPQEFSERLAAS
ncbi:MAG: hypothetical protein ACOY3X_03480 [Pseudomonadota bacterium]